MIPSANAAEQMRLVHIHKIHVFHSVWTRLVSNTMPVRKVTNNIFARCQDPDIRLFEFVLFEEFFLKGTSDDDSTHKRFSVAVAMHLPNDFEEDRRFEANKAKILAVERGEPLR